MESSESTKHVRLSSSNILTYKRDERGVIQWDFFQTPAPGKQTTGDFDEPDGDAGNVFTRQASVTNDQNDSGKRAVKSPTFYSRTGNLCQFQNPSPMTGSLETNHPVLKGCEITGDFPPCTATGSSASPLNDPEVKICANSGRMPDTAVCFPPQYSPLTPPATPKKSPRVPCQGQGQGAVQVQGHSIHKLQTPRDGSKFSFPESVVSVQKWPRSPSPRTTSSPCPVGEHTKTGQRMDNVKIFSPSPPGGGYPPKSPVVVFQFDNNVDETILKRIIKKFNNDVAKEADEIKPITLQDPPKSKHKKKQVRWRDDQVETDGEGEITHVAYMEEHQDLSEESNDEGPTVPPMVDVGPNGPTSHSKEDLMLRPSVSYPENVCLRMPLRVSANQEPDVSSPGLCHEDYIEERRVGKYQETTKFDHFTAYTGKNSSEDSDHEAPSQRFNPTGSKASLSGEDFQPLPRANDGCFPFTSYMEQTTVVSPTMNSAKTLYTNAMMSLVQQNHHRRPNETAAFACNVFRDAPPRSPLYRKHSATNPSPTMKSSSPGDSGVHFFQFPPSSPSRNSAFAFPATSPSSRQSPSGFRFPPSLPADRKHKLFPSQFRLPPASPSHTQSTSPFHSESSHLSRHKRSAVHNNDRSYATPQESQAKSPWNYHDLCENPKFPRRKLPPTENPWQFPSPQGPRHTTFEARETTLMNTNSSPGEARRRLFTVASGSSARSESDVDAALTNTILNYLVKKNILTPEDSERLRQTARSGDQTYPEVGRTWTSPMKYGQNQYSTANDPLSPEQNTVSQKVFGDEQIRILRQRGHSMGDIEDSLLARSVDLLQSPCFQRSHSLPVPSSPKTEPGSGRDRCRKRRRGNIDIRVECEEVTQRKRQLTEDLAGLDHPSRSASCFCGDVEDQILQMTREAYTNIRRHDDTPEAFERFENEVQQTNINITDALCILRTLKQLCGHGRTIEEIYPGSIVFRINCPSKSALVELWRWYRTGELLDLLQHGLVTDSLLLAFTAEEIRLKVTIEDSDFKSCLDELESAEFVDPHHYNIIAERNNENSPEPGQVTPKKSRHATDECCTPQGIRHNKGCRDYPIAASSSPFPMSPIRVALEGWDLGSPGSRPATDLSRFQARVPRSPVSTSTKPSDTVNVVREQTPAELLVSGELHRSLSPNRKAFQEINFSPR